MDEREATLMLMGAEVRDRKALKEEAKRVVTEYLRASPGEKWSLTTPTYQSKFDEPGFLIAAGEWEGAIKRFKVRKISIASGVSVAVWVLLTFKNGKTSEIKVSLVKERGIREPNLDSPLRIVGRTAPPYYVARPGTEEAGLEAAMAGR